MSSQAIEVIKDWLFVFGYLCWTASILGLAGLVGLLFADERYCLAAIVVVLDLANITSWLVLTLVMHEED